MNDMNYSETSILLLKRLPKRSLTSRQMQNLGNENYITEGKIKLLFTITLSSYLKHAHLKTPTGARQLSWYIK
jgi:hypothetical protein